MSCSDPFFSPKTGAAGLKSPEDGEDVSVCLVYNSKKCQTPLPEMVYSLRRVCHVLTWHIPGLQTLLPPSQCPVTIKKAPFKEGDVVMNNPRRKKIDKKSSPQLQSARKELYTVECKQIRPEMQCTRVYIGAVKG
jgi:hypothetical protein